MRGFRFRVYKVIRAKSEFFLSAGFAARVKDNKAHSFFFFAARAFGRTTREKPLVPRVLVYLRAS